MADLYLKALEAERKSLWAACRLKGLPKGTTERNRIEAERYTLSVEKFDAREVVSDAKGTYFGTPLLGKELIPSPRARIGKTSLAQWLASSQARRATELSLVAAVLRPWRSSVAPSWSSSL